MYSQKFLLDVVIREGDYPLSKRAYVIFGSMNWGLTA